VAILKNIDDSNKLVLSLKKVDRERKICKIKKNVNFKYFSDGNTIRTNALTSKTLEGVGQSTSMATKQVQTFYYYFYFLKNLDNIG
jgi:hypothetical protein